MISLDTRHLKMAEELADLTFLVWIWEIFLGISLRGDFLAVEGVVIPMHLPGSQSSCSGKDLLWRKPVLGVDKELS